MSVNIKRLLSLLLAVILVIGLPISAMAATVDGSIDKTEPAVPAGTEPAPIEPAEPLATEPTEPTATEGTEPLVTEEMAPSSSESTAPLKEAGPSAAGQSEVETISENNLESISNEEDGIMLLASTTSNLIFRNLANPDYTVRMSSEMKIVYKLNGIEEEQTAWIQNLGWHYATDANHPLYCLEPSKDFGESTSYNAVDEGVTLYGSGDTHGSSVWFSLPEDMRYAIGLILLYSESMWEYSYDVKTTAKADNPNVPLRVATQFLIWEIVTSCRNANTFVRNDSNGYVAGDILYNAGVQNLSDFESNYNALESAIQSALMIPSFSSNDSDNAETITLTGLSTTVTDTNRVLGNFAFTDGNGVKFSKSGNKLTITQTGTISESVVFSCSRNLPSPITSTYSIWYSPYISDYQTCITLHSEASASVNGYFKVEGAFGNLSLSKATEDSNNLAGWQFALYAEQNCNTLITGPLTTDSNGELYVEGLEPQTVWVKELGHIDPAINALYTCDSANPQEVLIEGNRTATVSFYNKLNRGSVTFKKATTTGGGVELGWTAKLWKIESDGSWTYIGSGTTKQDKTDPTYTFSNLVVGRYVLQEDPANSHSGYTIDTEYHYVEVTVNQTTTVTITNGTLSYAKIVKETNTGENLGGWKYNIYLDADLTELLPGSPFTTDDNGEIVTEVEPGTFFIVEVDESDLYPDWVFDDSIHVITVAASETGVATFTNRQMGRAKIIKVMPDGGSVAGWEYDLRRVSGGEFLGTFISQEDGTITTGYIEPGVYEITEKIPENSIYYCEAANPQTVTVVAGQTAEVTFTNRLKPAEISIQKVDTAGNPLSGAVFLLEWSVDGVNWLPISSTDSPYVTEGTCTSEGLLDGCLTSPETGLVRFTGLHPERYYRLTEISAPDGYQLLAGAAFEGTIPIDEGLTITLTVVNAPVYELPMTGSKSFVVMAVSLCICIAGCVSALVYLRRKEQ